MKRCAALLVVLSLIFSLHVVTAQDSAPAASCVDHYDPAVDYFPDKVEVSHAAGFAVEYHNHYKVVQTLTHWPGAAAPAEYLLVQCGTPAPAGYEDALMITVPVQRFVAMSTTQLAYLDAIQRLDKLAAIDSYSSQYTNNPAVQQRIADGNLAEVGNDASINVEVLLDLDPDVIMTDVYDLTGSAYAPLQDAGLPSVINGDWLEPTLLGRAEWVKFTSLFFNAEAQANTVFDQIVSDYESVASTRHSPSPMTSG